MTRRELVLTASAASAVVMVSGQEAPALPQNAEEELRAAREQNGQIARAVAAVALPMETEPACHFKA
ncbi:MAG TPA: hypothetical protein VKU01_33160 [Bryobacteraceae bacterium]|nr:hypothetical protein [Bryobacteraceae bacterium]